MFVTTEQLGRSPSGISCRFVLMGSAGMKVYTDRYRRDQCYSLQRYLHSKGFAPFCHFPFDFTGPSGEPLYAFWTDVAECAVKREGAKCECCDPCEVCEQYNDEISEWACRAEDVRRAIEEELGCGWSDDHCWNVGCINGNDVCIDCDPDYFYDLPDEFYEEWQYDSEEACIAY